MEKICIKFNPQIKNLVSNEKTLNFFKCTFHDSKELKLLVFTRFVQFHGKFSTSIIIYSRKLQFPITLPLANFNLQQAIYLQHVFDI